MIDIMIDINLLLKARLMAIEAGIGATIDWDWWTLACCHYDGTVSPKLIAAEIAESCAYEGVSC